MIKINPWQYLLQIVAVAVIYVESIYIYAPL